MSQARFSRRSLLRRGAITAGAIAAAPLTGMQPVFAGTPAISTVADNLSFARVWAHTARQAAALAGFDDTHAVHADGSVELLLWPGDRRKLDALGVDYQLFTPRQGGPQVARNTLSLAAQPGERAAYRRLGDYVTDIQALATKYPVQASAFKMPEKSLEGREVWGIEIADDVVAARTDGRPVFWVDGVHHSREWPSSELSMMFAFDLLESFGTDERISALLTKLRVIVVPVMNPDGFNHSREAALDNSTADAGQQFAYWRKNKRSVTGQLYGLGQTNGHLNADAHGTDPNRNYPFFWGGEGGGSTDPTSQTYGGSAPYAEPESRNVAGVMKANQVTAYLTNHTHGKLCMRPWGFTTDPSPDDDFQIELGDRMCEFHGYKNQIGLSLYPTAGTSRDWSYAALRTIVYTFEHLNAFHPTYTTSIPQAYASNRPAWLLLAEAAANPANHMVLTGRVVDASGAPTVADITLSKEFKTPTHVEVKAGKPNDGVAEKILSTSKTRPDGTFEIHANPSTRPFNIMVDETARESWTVTIGGTTREVYGDRGTVADLGTITI